MTIDYIFRILLIFLVYNYIKHIINYYAIPKLILLNILCNYINSLIIYNEIEVNVGFTMEVNNQLTNIHVAGNHVNQLYHYQNLDDYKKAWFISIIKTSWRVLFYNKIERA